MTTIDLQAKPYAEYAFEDPVTGVQGWLVVDTLVDELAFGGFRFHPNVTAQEVHDLARSCTSCAVTLGWKRNPPKANSSTRVSTTSHP